MRSPSRVSLWGHFQQSLPRGSLLGGTACSVQGTQELWSLGPERQEVWPPSQPEPPSPGFLSFKHSRDYVLVRFFFLQTGKQAQKGLLAGA